MSNLRKKLIRLAYQKPELRGDLLPLLKKAVYIEPTFPSGARIKPFSELSPVAQKNRKKAVKLLFARHRGVNNPWVKMYRKWLRDYLNDSDRLPQMPAEKRAFYDLEDATFAVAMGQGQSWQPHDFEAYWEK